MNAPVGSSFHFFRITGDVITHHSLGEWRMEAAIFSHVNFGNCLQIKILMVTDICSEFHHLLFFHKYDQWLWVMALTVGNKQSVIMSSWSIWIAPMFTVGAQWPENLFPWFKSQFWYTPSLAVTKKLAHNALILVKKKKQQLVAMYPLRCYFCYSSS